MTCGQNCVGLCEENSELNFFMACEMLTDLLWQIFYPLIDSDQEADSEYHNS